MPPSRRRPTPKRARRSNDFGPATPRWPSGTSPRGAPRTHPPCFTREVVLRSDVMSNPMGKIAADMGERPVRRHQFQYEDLREWLAQAEKLGEVRHVKGASWQSEIGRAAEIVQHPDPAPAVLFDEVPGCAQ